MNVKSIILVGISLIIFVTGSCTSNVTFSDNIQKIDVFEDNNQNIQLGKDLLFHDFSTLLLKEIPTMTQVDLQSILWENLIQSDTREVFFRLKLDMRNRLIRENKEKLIHFFKKEVKALVDFQLANKSSFDILIKQTELSLNLIDNHQYDAFWAVCHIQFIEKAPKDEIVAFMKAKPEKLGKLKRRSLLYKLNLKKAKIEADFYRIVFKSEYEKDTVQEYISWVKNKVSNSWEITGYGIRQCDQKCRN